MKILVVDDEQLARERVIELISRIGGHQVLGEAAHGLEAVTLCKTLMPDVVLMDIRMPIMDGLEAARHLSQLDNPPAIIFSTAYDQHVLHAFESHATDYLLKPVRQPRLEVALKKAQTLNRAQVNSLHQLQISNASRSHICARHRGQLILIPVEDIRFFHADQKYVTVGTPKHEVLIEESLKSLEHEFSAEFMRIHRATLVAKKYIQGLQKDAQGNACVVLNQIQACFPISRRLLADVKANLKNLKAG